MFRKGELVEEPTDITSYWRDDLVAFLIGCSLTFESALLEASVPIRTIEMGVGTCDYVPSLRCRPAGKFRGPMVVSLRPMTPVHMGDPATIGIANIN